MTLTKKLGPIRTVAILRGMELDKAVELARRSWSAGIDLVEVPVQDHRSWLALEAVMAAAEGRPVGAGTVTTIERAKRAIGLGVAVCISPGLHPAVLELSRIFGVPVLPGVLTPTEVQAASDLGVTTCKLFPAGLLGASYLNALRPVFPNLAFVPTGAVDSGNTAALVDAGACAIAFGGALERVLDEPSAIREAERIERPWIITPLPQVPETLK